MRATGGPAVSHPVAPPPALSPQSPAAGSHRVGVSREGVWGQPRPWEVQLPLLAARAPPLGCPCRALISWSFDLPCLARSPSQRHLSPWPPPRNGKGLGSPPPAPPSCPSASSLFVWHPDSHTCGTPTLAAASGGDRPRGRAGHWATPGHGALAWRLPGRCLRPKLLSPGPCVPRLAEPRGTGVCESV